MESEWSCYCRSGREVALELAETGKGETEERGEKEEGIERETMGARGTSRHTHTYGPSSVSGLKTHIHSRPRTYTNTHIYGGTCHSIKS